MVQGGGGGLSGRGADRERFSGREGDRWICISIKFSLKPNLHPDVQMLSFESPKSEVKRNVQKFHFLTEGRHKTFYFKKDPSAVFRPWIRRRNFHTFHNPQGHLQFLYTSAFWLFSSTFSSSFFSSSDEPFSFSPVFQLPCLFRRMIVTLSWGYFKKKKIKKYINLWTEATGQQKGYEHLKNHSFKGNLLLGFLHVDPVCQA